MALVTTAMAGPLLHLTLRWLSGQGSTATGAFTARGQRRIGPQRHRPAQRGLVRGTRRQFNSFCAHHCVRRGDQYNYGLPFARALRTIVT